MSDSEQCSNRLELDLISLLVNFSCELGPIMTKYDFLWARLVIMSNVRIDLKIPSPLFLKDIFAIVIVPSCGRPAIGTHTHDPSTLYYQYIYCICHLTKL